MMEKPFDAKKLFDDAKEALSKNPSEGQVEKSVVFPILHELGYKDKNILSKVPVRVKSGSKKYEMLPADVIARDDILPTLGIEAKSPKRGLIIPDDYSQGMSYCTSPDVNARFLFVTSGYSNRLYEGDRLLFEFDLKNIFNNIKKFKQALEGKLAPERELPTAQDIENFFRFCHDRMYAEDAIKPAEALHILTKLILIKTNEERGKNLYNLRTILEYEKPYQKADDSKKAIIADEIYKYIADCLKNVETDLLQPEEKTLSRNLSINVLFEIINSLNKYTLDFIPIERKGSAFDSFLNNTLKGRELGQFFTHRNIVNFMVEMANLKLKDRVIDPACGTGGFIEKSFLLLRSKVKDMFVEESKEYKEKIQQLQHDQIFGIDKDGMVASLAKLSMSMNGDGHTTIFKGDGLTLTNDKIKENSFDVILTNPPFGSRSVVQVTKPDILEMYDMGKKFVFNDETKRHENSGKLLDGQDNGVLFLERSIKLLKPDGFLGIILHDGVFSGSSNGSIRQFIRDHCRILAIIKLSDQSFKPYSDGGGTETTILLCKKSKEQDSDECFFGIAEKIGYKFKRKMIKPDDNDFPDLLSAFRNKSNYKSSKWVKLSTIPIYERLDPNFHCNKVVLPKGKFKKIKELLKDCKIYNGFSFASEQFGKGDYPLVKIIHLNNSLLSKTDLETIPTEYYKKCSTVKLEEGDILLGMDGKKEFRASYIDNTMKDVAVNQRVAIIRIDKKIIPSSYVFFAMISSIGQKQLTSTMTQTATVAHLDNDLIENIEIPILDDKIIQKVESDFANYIKSRRGTEASFDSMSKNF